MPTEHTGRQGLPQQAFRNTKALERKFEAAVDAAVFDELEKAFANLPPVEEAPDDPGV